MKLTKRKGFNFFRSYYDVYNELSDKDKVAFMDALLDRQFLGKKPENLKGMAKFAYISQTNSIDSQVKGYEDKTGQKLTPTDGATIPPTDGGLDTPTEQVQVEVEVEEEVQVEGEEQVKEKVKVEDKIKSKMLTEVVTSDVPPNEVLYFDIALKFHAAFRQVIVNAKGSTKTIDRAKYKTWVDPIRLMIENDGITREQINVVGKYVIEDSFWRGNIQSTSKLRDKFDKLIVQANEQRNRKNGEQQFSEQYKRDLANRLAGTNTSDS